jgi:predicted tellurium resistance membrane protein TerC
MTPTNFATSSLLTISIDVDNVLFTSAMSQAVRAREQNRFIAYVVLIEYAVRLALLAIVSFVFSGTEVLFTLFGVDFTAASLAILVAGLFLFVSASKELGGFLGTPEGEAPVKKQLPFGRAVLETSAMNFVLSIDSVIAVAGMADNFLILAAILGVSTAVRWLFVREIAAYVQANPSVQYVTSTFLILIGMTLILQGIQIEFPEEAFGLGVIAAFIIQSGLKRRRDRSSVA